MNKMTGTNKTTVLCANCGAECAPGTAEHYEERGYDWDNPDEDAQGSVMVTLADWYQHPVGPECVRAAIHTGHNDRFWRPIRATSAFRPTRARGGA